MTDRIVAITGAAGALGSVLAETLAAKGYKVALLDVASSGDRLAEIAARLGGEGRAYVHAADLGLAGAWEDALAGVTKAFGALPTHGALIAGGWAGGAPLHASKDDAVFDTMVAQNLGTAYRALRALLPAMVENKRGSVVVVGSRAAVLPQSSAGSAAYAAAKAGVVAMAQAVSAEVLEHGVRVNAILPSTMDTHANRRAMPKADFTKWVPLESAAGVVAFLLSDEARDVSGAALPVYGRA